MRDSKSARMVVLATNRGYHVIDEGVVIGLKGNPLKPNRSCYYDRITVSTGVKHQPAEHVDVHQLAAYQWFGEQALEDGIQVRHLDGNPRNNRRDNISFGTPSENAMDKSPEARHAHALTAAKYLRRVSLEQAEDIRRKREAGATYAVLCAEYGLCKSLVSYIINRKTYKHD